MAMREYKSLTNRILYTLAMDDLDLMDAENLIPTGIIIREIQIKAVTLSERP